MENRNKKWSGAGIKAVIDSGEVELAELLMVSKVSITTLYNIFRDEPSVREKYRTRVVGALEALLSRSKSSA